MHNNNDAFSSHITMTSFNIYYSILYKTGVSNFYDSFIKYTKVLKNMNKRLYLEMIISFHKYRIKSSSVEYVFKVAKT